MQEFRELGPRILNWLTREILGLFRLQNLLEVFHETDPETEISAPDCAPCSTHFCLDLLGITVIYTLVEFQLYFTFVFMILISIVAT